MLNRRKFIKGALAAPAILKLAPMTILDAWGAIGSGGIVAPGVFPEIAALNPVLGPGGAGTTMMPNPFVMYNGSPIGNLFQTGTAITTKAQWYQHRAEVKAMLYYYYSGSFPLNSPVTLSSQLADVTINNTVSGTNYTMKRRTFNLNTGPSSNFPFFINMYLPTSTSTPYGSGPFPTILCCEAGAGWLELDPTSGNSEGPGQAYMNFLINTYGYIFCEYSRDCFSPDMSDLAPASDDTIFTAAPPDCTNHSLSTPVTFPSRNLYRQWPFDRTSGTVPNGGAGLFDLASSSANYQQGLGGWTGYSWNRETAWFLGVMRSIDWLMTLSYVDKAKIASAGISRGSLMAYYVAAFDERIAVALSNQGIQYVSPRYFETSNSFTWYDAGYSGPGGCGTAAGGQPFIPGPNENDPGGTHAQILQPQSTPRQATLWQGAANQPGCTWSGSPAGSGATIAVYGGRGKTTFVTPAMAKAPFDCHTIISLIAPRWLYDVQSLDWSDSACCGAAQDIIAAQQVWTALGISNRTWTRYTDVAISGNQHIMTETHWLAHVQFCEYAFRGVALPASNFTVGSQSIWCNASAPLNTSNSNGATGLTRGYNFTPGGHSALAPIYNALGTDGNKGWTWSTPTLT
jgi:hypothetical protein